MAAAAKTFAAKTFAIVGTGVIGAGWAARALAHGLDVVAYDPAPGAEEKLRAAIDNAWPALEKQGLAAGADRKRLSYAGSIAEAVAEADFIQENAPEREELKQDLLAQIDAAAKPGAIIGSSTSGLLPSRLQARMACQSNPSARSEPSPSGEGAAPRACSLWLLSLARARESNGSPSSPLRDNRLTSVCGLVAILQRQTGFRPSPE